MQNRQQRIPFPKATETKIERCRRILAAMHQGRVRPASELALDYEKATAIATRASSPVDAVSSNKSTNAVRRRQRARPGPSWTLQAEQT